MHTASMSDNRWQGVTERSFEVLLMTGLCVLLGFVLGYARIKSESIWLAAHLHVLGNGLVGLLLTIAPPADIVISFGVGLPGLACIALTVALILRDPLWRSAPVQKRLL